MENLMSWAYSMSLVQLIAFIEFLARPLVRGIQCQVKGTLKFKLNLRGSCEAVLACKCDCGWKGFWGKNGPNQVLLVAFISMCNLGCNSSLWQVNRWGFFTLNDYLVEICLNGTLLICMVISYSGQKVFAHAKGCLVRRHSHGIYGGAGT